MPNDPKMKTLAEVINGAPGFLLHQKGGEDVLVSFARAICQAAREATKIENPNGSTPKDFLLGVEAYRVQLNDAWDRFLGEDNK